VVKVYNSILALFFVASFVSCDKFDNVEKGNVIARVGDVYLYDSDISKLIKPNMSKADSTLVVDAYINRWAQKKILLKKAELNLSEEEADFNRLIKEYREGLITSAYRQKLVSEYLDTLVTKDELLSFYDQNQSNFILNNDLVMVKYAIFPANISEKRSIEKLMKSDDLESFGKLEALCYQFSDRFSLSDSTWIPISELRMKIPELKNTQKSRLLKKGNFIKIQDSLNLYLTRIIDVRRKKSIAPLSFVDDRIHNIIINKRKLELMDSIEKQLINDAINNREFETYK